MWTIEESDIHSFFLCPFAAEVLLGSGFEEILWDGNVISPMDALLKASQELTLDQLGEYVAVMCECWNSWNRFIFGKKDGDWTLLASRAVSFIHSFREMRENDAPVPRTTVTTCWVPPSSGLFRLNFDAGKSEWKRVGLCGAGQYGRSGVGWSHTR